LQKKYACIGDVRGKGLMVGIELVEDENNTPASKLTVDAIETCKDMGLLVGKGGFYGNVLRITPPMCVTEEDINFIVDVLDDVFAKETT